MVRGFGGGGGEDDGDGKGNDEKGGRECAERKSSLRSIMARMERKCMLAHACTIFQVGVATAVVHALGNGRICMQREHEIPETS